MLSDLFLVPAPSVTLKLFVMSAQKLEPQSLLEADGVHAIFFWVGDQGDRTLLGLRPLALSCWSPPSLDLVARIAISRFLGITEWLLRVGYIPHKEL